MVETNQEKVWDSISDWWIKYRVHSLEEVRDFLKNKEGNILDLGCGTGRNFSENKGTIYGLDFSEKMLKHAEKTAKQKNIKVILKKSEADNIEFPDSFFDSAIFIATLHTIPTSEKRKKTLQELYRVMKKDADLLVTVWYGNKKHIGDSKEGYLPWNSDNKEYRRVNYIYDEKELASLLEECGFKVTKVLTKSEKTKFSRKNIIVFCKKI